MDWSVQRQIDERMCRPGYRWNHTLKRCIGGAGGSSGGDGKTPEVPEMDPPPAPIEATSTGRNSVRTNAKGMKQTGTSMSNQLPMQ